MSQPPPLRLTLAQLNPIVGDIDGNSARMLEEWLLWDDQTDLIIFPELCLCGYPPEDLILNTGFMTKINDSLNTLIEKSREIRSAALIPTPWTDGTSIYNAFLIISHGEVIASQQKYKLPNYYVFDEPRTFRAAPTLPEPIVFLGYKIGFLICEDLWYPNEVVAHLAAKGAQILIAINASPYDYTKHQIRKELAGFVCKQYQLSLVYLNLVGGQDELVFDGRSFIMHSNCQTVHEAAAFEEEIVNIRIEFPEPTSTKPLFSVLDSVDHQAHPTDVISEIWKAIKLGLKDYVHKNGFKKVILGLSGGIDSALVATAAVQALGAENVHCIMLPSEFTSQESLDDAAELAHNLGIKLDTIPITEAIRTFEKLIPNLQSTAHENTQSRIRGTILMALSNLSNALLLTTGNKSELAVGYATLYGDMNGAFNPLKDLYKTDIYKICELHPTLKNIIPHRIMTKAPTAELRENQTDQDSLPPYEILDDILRCLIDYDNAFWEQAQPIHLARRKAALKHPELVEKVSRLLRNAEFKRFQAAPGVRVSNRAFGKDRRYPITNHFLNIIEKD